MIKLSAGLNSISEEFRSECLEALECILPDGFRYMINQFSLIEKSKIVGEATKLKTNFRVNVTSKDDIKGFIENLGYKSGTRYNKYCGDFCGKGKKVIVRGYRKCMHNVHRHDLKESEPHKGPGRQPGAPCIPGKDTACPAKLKFSLSGISLHTSNRSKMSITRKQKDEFPLEIDLDFVHNHSINSADALRYRQLYQGNTAEDSSSYTRDIFGFMQNENSSSNILADYAPNDVRMLSDEENRVHVCTEIKVEMEENSGVEESIEEFENAISDFKEEVI